jgi:hypothetical protein
MSKLTTDVRYRKNESWGIKNFRIEDINDLEEALREAFFGRSVDMIERSEHLLPDGTWQIIVSYANIK